MRDTILTIVALATLIVFLGVLVWEVPRLDLGVIVVVTLALAVWDLFSKHPNGSS